MNAMGRSRFHAWHELAIAMLLVCVLAAAGALMPTFLNLESQLILSRHLWETAILALGMTLVIIAGGIDLSVGSAMGMCAVAFGMSFAATESLAVSSVACVALGGLGGALNGALFARLNVYHLVFMVDI
jgi:ribose/xylose/arabinose/galactoside ABC-type transport system permease subunit